MHNSRYSYRREREREHTPFFDFVAYFVLFLATPVPFEVHSAPTPRKEERDSMSIHRPPTHVPREVTTTHTPAESAHTFFYDIRRERSHSKAKSFSRTMPPSRNVLLRACETTV
jgi:hypothetical protein